MHLIRNITESDLYGGEARFMDEVSRDASRGILLNEQGQIAIMKLSATHLYKLPGGGIEDGEKAEVAFLREIKEETGYDAVIKLYLGYIDEHKVKNRFLQRSHCYIAVVASVQGTIDLTEEELVLGMQMEWMRVASSSLCSKIIHRNVG
ncbi:NUDIX hydrolase [Paenibacillus sp. NEAU-GSW1]|uniref:NUDIX hydrolase n=1 Tax=Paenibacillus sp. NEAU-GSW1 TaxID=2682486 RepID=UPI0012E2AE1E|nr:NUDIX domain-containing protein [Paenibacillus sp. NEAU-GSW1]MUT66765.1 NUDIX domain-containing protein [Paenibacillus sp. NEAU-GSW1]